MTPNTAVAGIAERIHRVEENIERVIVGKSEIIRYAMVALLTEGHLLIEDVPGTGKTTLAKAMARSIGCSFKRIQFTPDLLPSDVTGISFFNQKHSEFEFRPGPILAQIVLADEINRATPRTQSALLEAMEERQITVDGETIPLPRPFLVLATQNPIELEGTFPLPEAQLDRFLLKLGLGYPNDAQEDEILQRFHRAGAGRSPLEAIEPVISAEDILAMQREVGEVRVGEAVRGYLVRLVQATRKHEALELGASPRASLALYKSAQALAAINGRAFVIPDDIKRLAPLVLPHRMIPSAQTRLRGRTAQEALAEILMTLPVPVEELT